MPVISVTQKDLLRSKVIKPAWYRAKVERVGEQPAKTDGSTTYPVEAVITQDGDFKGVPLNWTFSEKAPGFAIKFIEACGGKIGPEGGKFDLGKAAGKELKVYVDNELYEGRMVNRVKDYASLEG